MKKSIIYNNKEYIITNDFHNIQISYEENGNIYNLEPSNPDYKNILLTMKNELVNHNINDYQNTINNDMELDRGMQRQRVPKINEKGNIVLKMLLIFILEAVIALALIASFIAK